MGLDIKKIYKDKNFEFGRGVKSDPRVKHAILEPL